MKETSKALQDLFYQYTHLPLGGKEVACPYWMNVLKKGYFGPTGGKGRPEDIVKAANEIARKAGIDLNLLSAEEIVHFLKSQKIGVDCSGFAFWLLDALDKEKGGDGLVNDLPVTGRFPASLASVKLLTSEKIAFPVSLKEVQVGDLIRLRHGRHVAVVYGLEKEGSLRQLEYVHSSSWTQTKGVHLAAIEIANENKGLEDQVWKEIDRNGNNYGQAEFFPEMGDSLYRLLLWA
jgi:uncharacterized Fe-S cluster-containing radical SAM superfamily protein